MMNKKQKQRALILGSVFFALCAAAALVLFALKQNLNLFYTPSQLISAHLSPNQTVRLGGFVEKNSVRYSDNGERVMFNMADMHAQLRITFSGVLPSLFREGQGVVVTGRLMSPTLFMASQVLAKHDEKYMPPSYINALKQS